MEIILNWMPFPKARKFVVLILKGSVRYNELLGSIEARGDFQAIWDVFRENFGKK